MANRNGSKDKQEQLTDDRFTSERLHSRCYYCVINFQCPHRKTKTADGRMRHPEVHRDWFPTIRLHASLAFLLVKLIKSKNGFSKQLSINRAACLRGKTGDWPVLLSVLS